MPHAVILHRISYKLVSSRLLRISHTKHNENTLQTKAKSKEVKHCGMAHKGLNQKKERFNPGAASGARQATLENLQNTGNHLFAVYRGCRIGCAFNAKKLASHLYLFEPADHLNFRGKGTCLPTSEKVEYEQLQRQLQMASNIAELDIFRDSERFAFSVHQGIFRSIPTTHSHIVLDNRSFGIIYKQQIIENVVDQRWGFGPNGSAETFLSYMSQSDPRKVGLAQRQSTMATEYQRIDVKEVNAAVRAKYRCRVSLADARHLCYHPIQPRIGFFGEDTRELLWRMFSFVRIYGLNQRTGSSVSGCHMVIVFSDMARFDEHFAERGIRGYLQILPKTYYELIPCDDAVKHSWPTAFERARYDILT